MRTPFVKRHTTPRSGVFAFFPLSRAWRSLQSVACSDLISVGRCPLGVAAPNTYRGAGTTVVVRAEYREGLLCGLESILCPHAVLFKGLAAPGCRASECQARERGSTRPWVRLAPLVRSQSRCPIKGQGSGLHGLCVSGRSKTQSNRTERTQVQAHPQRVQLDVRLTCSARYPWQKVSILKA